MKTKISFIKRSKSKHFANPPVQNNVEITEVETTEPQQNSLQDIQNFISLQVTSQDVKCQESHISAATESTLSTVSGEVSGSCHTTTTMIMPVPAQHLNGNYLMVNRQWQLAAANCSFNGSLAEPPASASLFSGENVAGWTKALLLRPTGIPYLLLIALLLLFFFPWLTITSIGGLVYLVVYSESGTRISKRNIKWTIQNFSEEIQSGIVACPSFLDASGEWRLVVSQKKCMEGCETRFGLLATEIAPKVSNVAATARFELTNFIGSALAPGSKNLKFVENFECPGDCGYTRPLIFDQRQLGVDDVVNITCRIHFQRTQCGFFQNLLRQLGNAKNRSSHPFRATRSSNCVPHFGTVRQENIQYESSNSDHPSVLSFTKFVQNSETKTFLWEIPNVTMILKNQDVWGIFSPHFLVLSNDLLTIWRMKLIEVRGVFRLHVQLRGLPKDINQVKLWYLLQIVDNFGDSVVPEHSVSRIKYPDHMNLWESTRHILYRRETLLERYLTVDGSLVFRISLHIQPNDLPLLERESDQWIS